MSEPMNRISLAALGSASMVSHSNLVHETTSHPQKSDPATPGGGGDGRQRSWVKS
ncbi:hypothetical protein FH972_004792 [Carpinus fangiana]|uniref:Uncharacterized protein n=1 Tax=Carpinus fangiana TaxID=176857 RepID=A0A5N6QQ55_9ROSI|nr:hypothetical protein FH972_004792 [Carpinus fangiana]